MFEISIKAASLADLKSQLAGLATELGLSFRDEPVPSAASAADTDRLRLALRQVRGPDARRFYLDVAQSVLRGGVLHVDADVVRRYGKVSGRSFSGMQAGATRVIDRNLHRRVITWPAVGAYAMSREDAQVVVEVLA